MRNNQSVFRLFLGSALRLFRLQSLKTLPKFAALGRRHGDMEAKMFADYWYHLIYDGLGRQISCFVNFLPPAGLLCHLGQRQNFPALRGLQSWQFRVTKSPSSPLSALQSGQMSHACQ